MSVFAASSASGVRDLSRVVRAVFVAGVRRTDAVVDSVVQSSGATASVCTVRFPLLRFRDEPARIGDRVEVWLDPSRTGAPKFRGLIVARVGRYAPDADTVSYEARDVRGTLADDVCSRDYNVVDRKTGTAEEALTVRQIASDIMAEYEAHQATQGRASRDRVQLALATIPDGAVTEFTVRGEPHGAALERLVAEAGDGVLVLRVRYHAGSNVLEAYQRDQGQTQQVRAGTDMTVPASQQAWGSPNVGEISEREDLSGIVNSWTLESPDVEIEEAVDLTPAWPGTDADLDALLAAASQTMQARMGTLANPELLDGCALLAGRLWQIPTITDLDGVARQLEPRPELLQHEYYTGEAMWERYKPRPFLAWQMDEGGEWNIGIDGFTIEGKYVLRDDPLTKTTNETESEDTEYALVMPVAGYYMGASRGIPTSIIGDPVNGIYTEPDAGGTKLTVNAGTYATPNLPTSESEITYNTELGTLVSTTKRPVWVNITSTRVRRKLPYAVKLCAAWVSKVPLTGATGRVGDVTRLHVRRSATANGHRYAILRNTLRAQLIGEMEVAGSNVGIGQLSEVAGPVVVADDSAALADLARRRSLGTREGALTQVVTLPFGDTGYDVGSLLAVNGRTLPATVRQIEYDMINLETRLVVHNQ